MAAKLLSISLLAFAKLGFAAHEYSDNDWAHNHDFVIKDLAPIWFFSDGACYPQAAEINGQQTNGNGASGCGVPAGSHLDSGCQSPGQWRGAGTQGTSFPTYWTTTDCNDGTRRVCYDIYFRHDSGHESDWEYACVVLSRASNGLWFRNGIILEEDPNQAYISWGDLETWDDGQSFTDGGKRNGNHAMIYSAKFHHTMFAHQYTGLGKNNCATTVSEMFRNNDFYWPAANNLQPGTNIPRNWNWGKAASNPQALASSVCGYHPF
ncbi:hypothetical protein TsFJ059_002038 [Trichoderma semiorbis]|uniref:Uncharacterized protein n=1 Tax=Trichoderma semiorbis TaxID=1491008 RepID=A0A9P8HKK1_9HYPO|nr:hypothetical protein TsFJ059_002038 [Trichoderma semiorbis]